MQFLLYVSTGMLDVDYSARDEAAGIIGSLRDVPIPVAAAESKEAITEMAYAHLGRHPSNMLLIADSNGLLYDIVINESYEEERSATGRALVVAWACFGLSMLSFVATVLLGLSYTGLILMVASIGLYFAIVRAKIFNETEATAVSVTLLVVAIFLFFTVESARRRAQKGTNNQMHESGEIEQLRMGDQTSPLRDW